MSLIRPHSHDRPRRAVRRAAGWGGVALAALLVLLPLAAPPARADDPGAAATVPATLPATLPAARPADQVIALPYGPEIHAAATADGKTLYLDVTIVKLHVWRLLTYHWPELVSGLLALVTLVRAVRLWRRPKPDGEEHCRRCGYVLRGLDAKPATRCPECGSELTPKNRVRYRSRRPALVRAIVAAVLAAGLLLGRGALPRDVPWGERWQWASPRLAELLRDRGDRFNLLRFARPHEELWAVDAESGRVVNHFPIQRTHPYTRWIVSPDGRLLLRSDPNGFNAALIDPAAGRVVHTLTAPEPERRGIPGACGAFQFSPDGRTLFASRYVDGWEPVFLAWDTTSGGLRSMRLVRFGGALKGGVHYVTALRALDDHRLVLKVDLGERGREAWVWDVNDTWGGTALVIGEDQPHRTPLKHEDGPLPALVYEEGGRPLPTPAVRDAATGRTTPLPPLLPWGQYMLEMTDDGRWLRAWPKTYRGMYPTSLPHALYDLRAGRWVANLQIKVGAPPNYGPFGVGDRMAVVVDAVNGRYSLLQWRW